MNDTITLRIDARTVEHLKMLEDSQLIISGILQLDNFSLKCSVFLKKIVKVVEMCCAAFFGKRGELEQENGPMSPKFIIQMSI